MNYLKNINIIVFNLMLIVHVVPILSQVQDIQFETITIADGIGDAVGVLDILQDENGYLWLATLDGLSRYDGYTFKSFVNNPFDSTTISYNRLWAICEARGYIWVSSNQGLDRFDHVTEEFTRFHHDPKDSALFEISGIMDIVHGTNCLWIASSRDGLIRFDLDTEKFSQFKHDPSDSLSISSNSINKLYIDAEDNLWIGCGSLRRGSEITYGLNRYDAKTNTFKRYQNLQGDPFSLLSNNVSGISEDNSGVLYVGTDESMLHKFDKANDRFIRLEANNPSGPFAPHGAGWNTFGPRVNAIHQDRKGYLWIGTSSGGINRYNFSSGNTQHYSFNPNEVYGLKSNNIVNIYEDTQGTIWIPMFISGITKVIPSRDRFHNFGSNSKYSDLLSRLYVLALYQDSKGKIWIGTRDGEIYCYNTSQDILKDFTPSIPKGARGVNVFFEDSRGLIWTAMRGVGGLPWILNSKTDRFEEYAPVKDDTIWTGSILNIFEDKQGIIWLGAERGLLEINPTSDSVKKYQRNWDYPEPGSLSHNKVYSSLYDSKGNYWFGSYSGLNLLNKKTNSFDVFLEEESIWSLLEDSKGRFWVGTRFHGLILFDRNIKETTKRFTDHDGLSSNAIYSLVEDSLGYIWIMTPPGLTRLDPESMTFTTFNETDGISNYFTDDPDATVKLKGGEILFGGQKGITEVHPDKFTLNEFPPKIVITKLNIFDKPYNERGALESSITLDYNQNDLTIEYVGLHFKEPSKNKYSVKLEPYEKEWQEANIIRKARYTNLSPGEYTFKVKAANSDGIWNEEGKSLVILINPPWWKTATAYIVYGIALILGIFGVDRFQRKRLLAKAKERMKIQDAEHRAKTAELQSKVIQAENDRKTKELEEARQLQLSMLPKILPKVETLDIAVYMQTATEVGGDYYDFSVRKDGSLNICLGDATGHGMKAGTLVSMMKSLFIANSIDKSISEFFSSSNEALKNSKLEKMMMAFAMINIAENKIEIANAGIPPIFIYRKEKEEIEEISVNGLPLGAMYNSKYDIYKGDLSEGDVILMLSDGMPELENSNNQQYGYKRVSELLAKNARLTAEEIIEKYKNTASDWVGDKDPDDDVTFVVIKVK